MLVEMALVIYLLLNRWECFLNGIQKSVREIMFFSRISICCLPLLLQQSEAPRLRHLVSYSCKKTGWVCTHAQGCFLKVFWLSERSVLKLGNGWAVLLCSPLSQWSHPELSMGMWVQKLWQRYRSPCLHFLNRKHGMPFRAWAPHMHPCTVWKGKKVWDFQMMLSAINSLSMSFQKFQILIVQ